MTMRHHHNIPSGLPPFSALPVNTNFQPLTWALRKEPTVRSTNSSTDTLSGARARPGSQGLCAGQGRLGTLGAAQPAPAPPSAQRDTGLPRRGPVLRLRRAPHHASRTGNSLHHTVKKDLRVSSLSTELFLSTG